jgi:TatD DNase family protein
MKFFDSHCHLQFPQYEADLDAVLLRMQEKEMGAVVVGTDLAISKAAVALAAKHDFLWASVGLHPNDPSTPSINSGQAIFDEAAFRELAAHPKVVAIGECGLDYLRTGKTAEERAVQLARFEAQVQLALETDKTLIIHCRDAHEDMVPFLAAHRRDHGERLRVIMHFFTGTEDLARRYLDVGCYLSYPGPVTYTDMYDAAIRATPMDKLLIETDAPFAAPVPNRGKRNEPAYVVDVAQKVAALKGLSVEEVGEATAKNAKLVFGLQ